MKYKKISYILVLILILMIGINKTYAEESKKCYYISNEGDFKATLKLSWGYGCAGCHGLNAYTKVSVDKVGQNNYTFNNESVLNWWSNLRSKCVTNGSTCFTDYYKNSGAANKDSNPDCPKHLVFQHCTMYAVWATESTAQAKKAVEEIHNNNCTGFYASHEDANGKEITSEDYYSEFSYEGLIELNDQGEPTCNDYESLFGSKDDPESIRYLLETVLQYVRIIVPILIILMGTLDLGKAVLANKEDTIKKAQMDFVKRVIIGVAVFFVPLLVDIVMWLADLVWQGDYIHCDF